MRFIGSKTVYSRVPHTRCGSVTGQSADITSPHSMRDEAKLPEGSVFIADLIGCRALDEDGAELGRIEDVLTMPSSDVYVIEGARSYMIPAVKEFVKEIDAAQGIVRVHLIEGMATDEN